MVRIQQETAAKIRKYCAFLWTYIMAQGPRLAYIGGVYDLHNLGDEALYDATKILFHKCSVLKFPRKQRLVNIAKLLPLVHYAVLAGGTLVNREEIWLQLMTEYMEICPYFFVFGSGVAHPSFWKDSLKEWKPILEKCDYVGVRGPLSAELLTDIGIANVDVVGDPVLVFAPNNWKNCDLYIPNSIGLNIGWDRITQWGEPEKIYAECVKLATFARRAGWKVRWFAVWPPDLAITRKLAKISGTEDEIYEIYSNASEYIELVKPLSVFVGTRLHSAVLATCAYVPSIMLEYRPKCRDYMMSIGQEDYTIRTDKFKAEDVWDIVIDWNSKRESLSEALYQSIKPLRDKQRAKAEELMKTMMGLS